MLDPRSTKCFTTLVCYITHQLGIADGKVGCLPVFVLGSRIAPCNPWDCKSRITAVTLGIRSTVLPAYTTSVSANTNLGCIWRYLSKMPYNLFSLLRIN